VSGRRTVQQRTLLTNDMKRLAVGAWVVPMPAYDWGPLTPTLRRAPKPPARSLPGGGRGLPRLRFLRGAVSACADASPSITLGAKSMAS
jgi:hypothetical protein